jgi:hypothetical protein
MNATKRYRRLSEVPLRTLRRWLRTVRSSVGGDSGTAKVLRREIASRNTKGEHRDTPATR